MIPVKELEKLHIPSCFGLDSDANETNEVWDVVDQLHHLNINYEDWNHGMSKFVLLFDKEVVKIPFNGSMVEIYNENYDIIDYEFQEFIGAKNSNYCSLELAIYNEAVDFGIEQFFTKTWLVGYTADRTPIYGAEKVKPFYDSTSRQKSKPSQDSIQAAFFKQAEEDINWIDNDWLARAIDWYGMEAVNDFITFVETMDINDLHTENIGFREDGSPVVFDYSSYNE